MSHPDHTDDQVGQVGPRFPALDFRVVAIAPIVLFIPSLISFAITKPGAVWPEYPGVFFHLAFLLLVARLRAPEWARAAGYGWLTLDVLTGILAVNGLPYDTTWPVRMGGHVLAGVWLVSSSLYSRRLPIRIVGVLTGVILGGYSFVGNVLPLVFIQPSGIGLIVWLALLAIMVRPGDLRAPYGGRTQTLA